MWDVEVLFPNIVLNACTYWWDVTDTGTSPTIGIWMPTIGQTSGNARQLYQGSWSPIMNGSLPQELSFKVISGAPAAVPEPGEWAGMGILGAGLAGLVLRRRRR